MESSLKTCPYCYAANVMEAVSCNKCHVPLWSDASQKPRKPAGRRHSEFYLTVVQAELGSDHHVSCYCAIGYYDFHEDIWCTIGDGRHKRVTNWMPLPEIPGE